MFENTTPSSVCETSISSIFCSLLSWSWQYPSFVVTPLSWCLLVSTSSILFWWSNLHHHVFWKVIRTIEHFLKTQESDLHLSNSKLLFSTTYPFSQSHPDRRGQKEKSLRLCYPLFTVLVDRFRNTVQLHSSTTRNHPCGVGVFTGQWQQPRVRSLLQGNGSPRDIWEWIVVLRKIKEDTIIANWQEVLGTLYQYFLLDVELSHIMKSESHPLVSIHYRVTGNIKTGRLFFCLRYHWLPLTTVSWITCHSRFPSVYEPSIRFVLKPNIRTTSCFGFPKPGLRSSSDRGVCVCVYWQGRKKDENRGMSHWNLWWKLSRKMMENVPK